MAATSPIPVWLDCDPGHDDVFAILLAAYHPNIRLLGISTVYGNASLKHTTWNATSILTAMAKEEEVSVYPGAAKPMSRSLLVTPADIHGETGLDGTDLLPTPRREPDTSMPALDAMYQALMAEPAGTAWLVATGSLTNAGQVVLAHPDLADHLAGVSIMGGAIGDGFTNAVTGSVDGVPRIGNTTFYAEFNILSDPEAAAALLHHPKLAPKTTLIPLDLTHLVLATAEVQSLLLFGPQGPGDTDSNTAREGKTTLRTMLVQLLNFFADTYRNVYGITDGPPLHDPLAVAAVLMNTPFEIPFYDYNQDKGQSSGTAAAPAAASHCEERFEVRVVTEGTNAEALNGKAQTGRTVARLLEPGRPGVRIPRSVDLAAFWRVIEECCERADAANAQKAPV